jgi:hypothetical protein
MKVNGHRLPDSFLTAVASGFLRRDVGSWQLRSNHDASGHPLETELGEIYYTLDSIKEETASLPDHFEPNGVYGESLPELAGLGAIPDIMVFEDVVCFGISGDGAPFCFDYRESGSEPKVIWWDDVYWRVVAPDFDSFLSLFNLQSA